MGQRKLDGAMPDDANGDFLQGNEAMIMHQSSAARRESAAESVVKH